MDVDLPVWTIRPNWSQGVLERLEWLTAVMTSDTGAEQRTALRRSPRRSFEITVNPTRNDRTYLDLTLHRLGSEEWLFPLWHDQAAIEVPVEVDDVRLDFDNTFREFADGGYAILYLDTFTWEVVQIEGQDEDGLDLSSPIEAAWPAGTKVYPLRRALIQTDTSIAAITSRVGQSVLLFQLNEANDWPEMAGDAMVNYSGSPLLTLEPNRSQEINTTHTRFYDEADGETGLRYRTDSAGRSFSVQSHNWMVSGREQQAGFRSFLYTLRGRQRMVWLPTFNDDLTVAREVDDGDLSVSIEKVGLGYVGAGSPIPGRARIWTGSEVLLHAGYDEPLDDGEELLTLVAPTTEAYAPGASWAFLDAYRLNQDVIELHHHTDSDGTFECSATFQAFANVRDGSGSNFEPIPESAMTTTACGSPLGLSPCVPHDCTPMSIFNWDLAFNGCNPGYCPTRNWYMPTLDNGDPTRPTTVHPPLAPGGPSGNALNTLSVVNNCNASGTVYERDDYINPASAWYQNPLAINLRGQPILTWSTTNGSFQITVIGCLATGGGQVQIQYGPFWCGDNIAIGNLTRTDVSPPECTSTPVPLVTNVELVGNVPYTFVW